MKRSRIPLLLALLLLLLPAGCGESDPDPATILDRALTRENLAGFGSGPGGPTGGTVTVQALGYEDRVLEESRVHASREVMSEIRSALGADSGLRAMAGNLVYEGSDKQGETTVEKISGELDREDLARALKRAGGVGELGSIGTAGASGQDEDSLADASFELVAGREDGTIKRLALTLSLDDPDNALPPTRVRFSLVPDPPSASVRPQTTS